MSTFVHPDALEDLVDRRERREAVVAGGPGLDVVDQVVGAAVGHVDAVGERVADPGVLDRHPVGVQTPVEADHVLGPDVVDRDVRDVLEVEHLAGAVDPDRVVAEEREVANVDPLAVAFCTDCWSKPAGVT
jgi:hypothetical protein